MQYLANQLESLTSGTTAPFMSNQKMDEIYQTLIQDNGFDIIGISETKLDANIADKTITFQGYHPPFRKDRNRRGGGVCLYVNENIPTKRRIDLEGTYSECVD